ncbi:MAG: hypothetical protein EOP38_16955 [Rubrivivax sp.]|nr:MAG: hypothetical protein EOP38_16955 [Rubrivivax sp.]
MQVDALAVELRPRSMSEAADLGVLLVQGHARSIWRTCGPVFGVVLVLALSTVEIAPWLPGLVIFWLKPWLDRSILFVLSRALFGQATTFADLWRERSDAWWRQWPRTLTFRRLSPWRSFTQPIYQLEGQSGQALRQRRSQLLAGQRWEASLMHTVFANVEFVLNVGLMSIAIWLAPKGGGLGFVQWLGSADGLVTTLLGTLCYAGIVFVLEPFYVSAGFAMYLNRRVELEAWDIEQEFRRAFGA